MPMQAIVQSKYGTIDDLGLQEVDIPVPAPGEVLVRVHAAAVNDWDLGLVAGKPLFMRIFLGLFRSRYPIIGCEVAGVVEGLGSGVSRYQKGDRVYGDLSNSGFGAFAEYVCVKETSLESMPTRLSFEQAAAIPHAALLALQGLRDIARLKDGQSLLINGAGGGVGTLAVQIAKLQNCRVTGVDSTEKLDYLRLLGFDEVIDYTREDFTRRGKQYDVILDARTTRSPFAYARALNPGGTYVTIGGSMPRVFQCALLGRWIARRQGKRIQVLGLKPNLGLDYISGLVDSGKLMPAIDSRFPLAEVKEALRLFESAVHRGKVIITVFAAGDSGR